MIGHRWGFNRWASQAGNESAMGCRARSSDLLCSPAPALREWLIYMLLCLFFFFSIDILRALGTLALPSARVGPGLSSLGLPDGGLPLVLTNTFPSPNTQNWTNWPLFPWDQDWGGLSPSPHHTSSFLRPSP